MYPLTPKNPFDQNSSHDVRHPKVASFRIILNTGILYVKMIITIFVSLYSVRLILNALGASDFGIYNVVGGIISALAFLQSSMTVSTQRFLSYHQGAHNQSKLNQIFGSSMALHIVLGFVVLLILYIVQPLLFHDFLNIPEERIFVAKNIYSFMSFSIFCTILSVPFLASLNAHENMLTTSVIGIIQVSLNLLLALSLSFSKYDRLILYGVGILIINAIILIFYYIYCQKKYPECSFSTIRLSNIFTIKEMISFTGWNTFGALSGVSKNHGLSIVFNLFYGTIINAAWGIANQIASQLNAFSSNLLKAMNPQIMKSEGANDRERMMRLSMIASKYGFYLGALFCIPFVFEMHSILAQWLTNVPENTAMFCQTILISLLISQTTVGIQSAIQATGNIKLYMILVGATKLALVPLSYLFLQFGLSLFTVMVAFISLEMMAGFFRLICLRKSCNISIMKYFRVVYKKIIPPLGIIVFTGCFLCRLCSFRYRFLLTIPVMMLSLVLSIYFFEMTKHEKRLIHFFIKTVKQKIFL